MTEGTILTWLKASGDQVRIGDELLEIETDKATVSQLAEVAGVLEILAEEGTTVAVGEPIARIGAGVPQAEPSPAEAEPEARATSDSAIDSSSVTVTAAAVSRAAGNGHRRTMATPLARRCAAVHGVALDGIQGTGPLGRITRSDVLSHAGLGAHDEPALPTIGRTGPPPGLDSVPAPPHTTPAPALPLATRRVEPSRLQRLIARRMAEAKATVPHFQVQIEVAMDRAIALRAELKSVAGEGDPVPSLNDIIIKATAIALREHPLANGSYQDDGFVLHDAINVGMAVAAGEALVVPIVFDAAGKSLGQIARETRALAARVRSDEISPAELEGGTFTVSNLGAFGMTAIVPVINPPQAAILGVGATRDVLVRAEGEIVDQTLLTLTLSCDHRILYGADAARFLSRIRELLEMPLKLVL